MIHTYYIFDHVLTDKVLSIFVIIALPASQMLNTSAAAGSAKSAFFLDNS